MTLQSDQEGTPDPSTCRVRVLFLNSDGEDKEWMEMTDDLRSPVHFDGTFVTFQVERFYGWEELQILFFSFKMNNISYELIMNLYLNVIRKFKCQGF